MTVKTKSRVMPVRKRRALAALLLASSVTLGGCWDRQEINDVAFVLGSALDKVEDRYRATIQFPLPSNLGGAGSSGGGGGTGGSKAWYTDSVQGKTLSEMRYEQQRSISRSLFLGHRRIFLIGEELAKSDIRFILDETVRNPISRLDTFVLITEGEAMDVLNSQVTVEKFPSEKIRELANSFMKRPVNFKYIVDTLSTEGVDMMIPYVKRDQIMTGDEKQGMTAPKIDSLAVFRHGTMVGVLSGYHAGSLLWFVNEARRPLVVIPSPEGKGWVAVQMQKTSSKIRPIIRGKDISFRIEMNGYGFVTENISTMDLTDGGNLRLMERELRRNLEERAKETMAILQRDWNVDPLGLGRKIHEVKPGLWHEIKEDWRDLYREIDVIFEANVHIDNTGLIVSPAGIEERKTVD